MWKLLALGVGLGDFLTPAYHRGSQLYFYITRYVLKEEGRTLFLLPK
jgi:hypothetical protein